MKLTRRQFVQGSAALAVGAACAPLGRAPGATPPDSLAGLDALGQADLVRRGEVTARELVEAAIARIERLNPALNAVVTRDFERALARAEGTLGDGPFAGVPYLVKDLTDVAGLRTSFGCSLFSENVAEETHEVIRRSEAAGLVVLGKSNTPEFGLLPTTQPRLFGPTRNPWDPARDPGGSSGGAAAAVAAGLVPLAQASDGGGSIRVPACNCGLFGLKPSRARNPEGGPRRALDIAVRHCVSRSVRDSQALLRATHVTGAEGSTLPPPVPAGPPRQLRIATAIVDMHGRTAHPDCIAAVERAAKLCEELGHRVEEASPTIDGGRFIEDFITLWSSGPGALVAEWTARNGEPPPRESLETWTWGLADHFASLPEDAVARAVSSLRDVTHDVENFQETYDLWLTPTLSSPAVRIGELAPDVPYEENLARATEYVSWTPIANVTGGAAMSVPLHWNDAGLPVGSHFLGRRGEEATLLALAAQLEEASPWAGRWPALGF